MRESGRESILINDPVLAKKFHDDPRVCMSFVNLIEEYQWLSNLRLYSIVCLSDNTSSMDGVYGDWAFMVSSGVPLHYLNIPLQSPSHCDLYFQVKSGPIGGG